MLSMRSIVLKLWWQPFGIQITLHFLYTCRQQNATWNYKYTIRDQATAKQNNVVKRKKGADCYKQLANIQKSIRCMADTKIPFILTWFRSTRIHPVETRHGPTRQFDATIRHGTVQLFVHLRNNTRINIKKRLETNTRIDTNRCDMGVTRLYTVWINPTRPCASKRVNASTVSNPPS